MPTQVYTPVLMLKQAELKALRLSPDASKMAIRPLFEISPIPLAYPERIPSKTLAQHVEKLPIQINNSWGSIPFYIDCKHVAARAIHEPQVLESFYMSLLANGNAAIPVLGVSYHPAHEVYVQQILKMTAHGGKGICIRVASGDLNRDYLDDVQALLKRISLTPESVDIVIDLATISPNSLGPLTAGTAGIINSFPHLQRWRSFVLAATAFPASMSPFETNSASITPRAEWIMWRTIVENRQVARIPTFGDYGISSAEPFEMDPRMMKLGAKIKYTLDNDWLIVKGAGIESNGSGQFHGLCDSLIASPYYYGEQFSDGDLHIKKCAVRDTGPGNQSTWLYVGMNHHFAVVRQQLDAVVAA